MPYYNRKKFDNRLDGGINLFKASGLGWSRGSRVKVRRSQTM